MTRSTNSYQPTRRSPRFVRMDPVEQLDEAAVFKILERLGPKALAKCCVVAKQWKGMSEDEKLWKAHCQELWKVKVYVPKEIREAHPKEAYVKSLGDSQRNTITQDELCSFAWSFRFRRVAGLHWMQHQKGRMLRQFHPDGSITAPSKDLLWLQHEEVANRWRMRKTKLGRKGCFVQINHWPSLELRRSEEWGWSMRNQWVVYKARFPGPLGQQGQLGAAAAGEQQAAAAAVEWEEEGPECAAAAGNDSGDYNSSSGSDSDGEFSLTSDSGGSSSDEEADDDLLDAGSEEEEEEQEEQDHAGGGQSGGSDDED